ncbi:hypothetical protein [Chlorobium sp. KB01]|uniref:hypothetical protein n=1 Tax=Chlorobium sp. KB01 TaxID=1917528 RepID=UPI0034CEB967
MDFYTFFYDSADHWIIFDRSGGELQAIKTEEIPMQKQKRYETLVEQIVERWAEGKPANQMPGSTSTKPCGYYRLTNYLLEYMLLHNAFPAGVHAMPEGRDRFNQVEPSFPVDFDSLIGDAEFPG